MPRIPTPIPLASVKGRTTLASDERLINAYAEAATGKDLAVYVAPGLSLWSAATVGENRGIFTVDSTMLAVKGDKLYRFDAAGIVTTIGTIPGTGLVKFARNARVPVPQVLILTNLGMWIVDGTTLTAFADPDLPANPIDIAWSDGYFILVLADGRFYVSGINDVTVNALDFASAESNPDGNVGVGVLRREIYIFGTKTTEVFSNTGNSLFPFERLPGAVIDSGCASRNTIRTLNEGGNSALYWLDQDGNVVRAQSYSAEIISDRGVFDAVNAVTNKSEISAFTYAIGQRRCYVLTHANFTWVFDALTARWHERKSLNLPCWLANAAEGFAGKTIIGSAYDDRLFELTEASFTEAGTEMVSVMRFPRIMSFPYGGIIDQVEFDIETGVGRDDGGRPPDTVEPKVTLRWSKDGGKTYGGGRLLSLGQKGEFRKRVRTTRLGSFTDKGIIFELSASSDCFKALFGCSIMTDAVQT